MQSHVAIANGRNGNGKAAALSLSAFLFYLGFGSGLLALAPPTVGAFVDLRSPIRAPRAVSTIVTTRPIRDVMQLQQSLQPQEASDQASRSCYKRTIYILRHGQTDYNARNIEQGSSDFSRLTELGRSQAASLGRELGGTASSFSVTNHVYISPLTRARDTYKIVKDAMHSKRMMDEKNSAAADASASTLTPDDDRFLPPTSREYVLHNLREIDLYDWEGMHADDIIASHPESWAAWKAGDPHAFTVESSISSSSLAEGTDEHNGNGGNPSSTSLRYPLLELWERAQRVWDEIHAMEEDCMKTTSSSSSLLPETSSSLIVCHGSLGQALLGTAMGRDATFFGEVEIPNCGIVQLEWMVDHNNVHVGDAHSWEWFPLSGSA